MKHLSEEEFVDAYYGDIPAEQARHLTECEKCRTFFERRRELLDGARVYPVPERGPGYGGEVWARVLPHLQPLPSGRGSVTLWKRWWLLAPAFAAMLAVAFLAGRWTERIQPMASIPEKARERVLLLSLSEHLERSQIVLAELVNGDASSSDLLEERERARELVGANRLLQQTAERLGDKKDAAVLEDLEHVLLEVANAPDAPTSEDALKLQRRIAENELLFKVRITTTDTRERGLRL